MRANYLIEERDKFRSVLQILEVLRVLLPLLPVLSLQDWYSRHTSQEICHKDWGQDTQKLLALYIKMNIVSQSANS